METPWRSPYPSQAAPAGRTGCVSGKPGDQQQFEKGPPQPGLKTRYSSVSLQARGPSRPKPKVCVVKEKPVPDQRLSLLPAQGGVNDSSMDLLHSLHDTRAGECGCRVFGNSREAAVEGNDLPGRVANRNGAPSSGIRCLKGRHPEGGHVHARCQACKDRRQPCLGQCGYRLNCSDPAQ